MARLTPCCALNSVLSSVSRSSIWQAARKARSASSSRTIGTPKVAMTESPMNFWTVPPQASIVEVMTEKKRWRRTRQRSGSKRSPSVVEPVMSAKRTVTSLRSSAARSASDVPQDGQKRAPAGTEAEHFGHAASIATVEAYIGIWLRSTRREMNPRSPSYRSMPLSAIQKGAVGQFAFLATALVTGRGQVEVYTPAADNEGRDAEVRRHLRRAASIGIQIKVAFGLHHVTGHHGRTYLEHRFVTPEKRLRNDPRLWYFVAVYDLRQLRYLDPVFLIPSAVMHRLGRCGRATRGIQFEVIANLLPTSRDKWSPYRVALSDLGKRLLEIIDEAPLKATADVPTLAVEGVWLSRIGARSARRVRSARPDLKYSLIRKAVLQRVVV